MMGSRETNESTGANTPDDTALSGFQRRILASEASASTSPHNNMILLVELPPSLDPDRFCRAVHAMMDAHSVFGLRIDVVARARRSARDDGGQATLRAALPRAELDRWLTERNAERLDLSKAAFESVLLDHEGDGFSWYIKLHHTITDGHSVMVMMQELSRAYADAPLTGSDFFAALQDISSETPGHDWGAAPEAVGALYQPDNPGGQTAGRHPFALDPDQETALAALIDGPLRVWSDELSHMVFNLTVLAVWAGRLGRRDRLRIGVPLHQRNAANAHLIGPRIELFPLDVNLTGAPTFRALHSYVAERTLDLLRHAEPETSPAQHYEFVMNFVPGTGEALRIGDLDARLNYLFPGALDPQQIARFQIHRFGMGPGTPATGRLQYELNLRDTGDGANGTAAGPEHLLAVMRAAIADPDVALGDIEIATPQEVALRSQWGRGPAPDYPATDLAGQLRQALDARDDPVVDDIPGREVLRRAEHLADYLRARDIGPGRRVGLALPPGVDYVATVFGCVLAGASFVPQDQTLPPARAAMLARKAGLALRLEPGKVLDDILSGAAGQKTSAPPAAPRAVPQGAEAYLLFTSGTTGTPKGVPITRVGLTDYLGFAVTRYFGGETAPVAPLFGNLGFDLTLTTLFAPILAGGRIITIAAPGAEALPEIAARTEVTWLKATPSHLGILAPMLRDGHGLNTLVIGGEALGQGLVERLRAGGRNIRIFNEYGPTEAVVGCMIHDARDAPPEGEANVPIGRPAPGVFLRIVDLHDRDQPPGVAGELLIAREGMTSGYVMADAETDADTDTSFVTLDGQRFYRTGDLAYLTGDGAAVYLGRIDSQMKVGGVRLEPEEIERALERHAGVDRAVVRYWSPRPVPATHRCPKCGLPDNVPGVHFDVEGLCSTCRDFEAVAQETRDWFRTPEDLQALLAKGDAGKAGTGGTEAREDCMFLLSGGKDSTYALYGLVELGLRPYVFTLDNGYLSEDAKRNISQVVSHLGLRHEFSQTPAMKEIFRDSLSTFSNVCQGCFKTIYTLALQRADALGLDAIVTGLSRGQLFETRLVPQQFGKQRFDPDAIDAAVLAARKNYHLSNDLIRKRLDNGFLGQGEILDRIRFVDFYRYVDVSLTEVLRYLGDKTPWQRPRDTGRSSNCLINVAGIHTHLTEQGYHNYAVPYAWDVRLGHKTRQEAIEELEDGITPQEVDPLLEELGYSPEPRRILTAWWTPARGAPRTSGDMGLILRRHLQQFLPDFAMPQAFVRTAHFPVTASGKLDQAALPAPKRKVRNSVEIPMSTATGTEARIIAVWENILQIAPVGPTDRFAALGGDSLMAVSMIVELSRQLGITIPERLGFQTGTLADLAAMIDALGEDEATTRDGTGGPVARRDPATPPPMSIHEKTLFFEHRTRPDSVRYNVCSLSFVTARLDEVRLAGAVRAVAAAHEPLSWSYGARRKRLDLAQAVDVRPLVRVADREAARDAARAVQAVPFDLGQGPRLRCLPMVTDEGETAVALVAHHISCDHASFRRMWEQIDAAYGTGHFAAPAIGYSDVVTWQEDQCEAAGRAFWLARGREPGPAPFDFGTTPGGSEPDGLVTLAATVPQRAYDRNFAATPVAVTLAATMQALRPYATGDRMSVGLISSSRSHPASRDLVGYFLNPVPIVVDYPRDLTFDALLGRVEADLAQVLEHRTYPFAHIHADRLDAGLTPPQMDVLVAVNRHESQAFQGYPLTEEYLFSGSAVATLTFFNQLEDENPQHLMEYAGARFSKRQARAILKRFNEAIINYARASSVPD